MELGAALGGLLAEVAAGGDSATLLQRIVERAQAVSGAESSVLCLMDEGSGALIARYGVGPAFKAADVRCDLPESSSFQHPLKDRFGRLRALLELFPSPSSKQGEEWAEAVGSLAELARIVLERTEQAQREEALIRVANSLDHVVSEEQLIQTLLDVAGKVLQLQACSIFLLDPGTDSYLLRGATGALRSEVGKISYRPGEGFTGWVCREGKPILLNDPQSDPRWRGKYVEIPSEDVASFLAVPIFDRHESIGAIRVLRRKTGGSYLDNTFTTDELRLVQTIAEQVSAALANLRNIDKIVHGERLAAWGELSAKSSHMIGNRVFALKGDVNELGHLVNEPDPKLPEVRHVQKSLQTNLARLDEILQDFRDFVTATKLNRAPTDLAALVKETALEFLRRQGGVVLELDVEGLPLLELDEKKIRRAVSELIENSMTHMELGTLRVRTAVVDRHRYEATKRSRSGEFASVVIEDTGPGVRADQKAQIFQPFFSGRVRGMGLGLSIVKGIIDAHGGEVFEIGDEGAGAKFVILIPIPRNGEEPAA